MNIMRDGTLADIRLSKTPRGSWMDEYQYSDILFGRLNLRTRSALIHSNFHDYSLADAWNVLLDFSYGQLCLFDLIDCCGLTLVVRPVHASDYSMEDDPC